VVFRPKNLGESQETYFQRIDQERSSILLGEYIRLGKQIKFSFYLKKSRQEQEFLGGFKIENSKLLEKLLNTSRVSIASTRELTSKWDKVLLVFQKKPKESLFNSEEIISFYTSEIESSFRKRQFKVINSGNPKRWNPLPEMSLRKKIQKTLTGKNTTLAIVLSLSGSMQKNKGFIYKGITVLSIHFSAYHPNGTPLWNHSFDAKRFSTKSPAQLNREQIRMQFFQTLRKGLKEYKTKFIGGLFKQLGQS